MQHLTPITQTSSGYSEYLKFREKSHTALRINMLYFPLDF